MSILNNDHATKLLLAATLGLAMTVGPALAQRTGTGGGAGGEGGSGSPTEHQGPGHATHPRPGSDAGPPSTRVDPARTGVGGGIAGGSGAATEHQGPGHTGHQTNTGVPAR